jgi:hypothetical protein
MAGPQGWRCAGPLTVGLLAALAVGCGGEPPSFVARDSAGVRVVENGRPARDEPVIRVGEPELDLGGADAPPETAFRGVVSAFLMPSGALVVAHDGSTVQWFEGGAPRATAGGTGDGPGEFQMIAAAGSAGDSVWVYDYSHRRITFFDPDGGLGRMHTLPDGGGRPLPVGRLDGGRLVVAPWVDPDASRTAPGLRRDTVPYFVYRPGRPALEEVSRLPGREFVVGEEDGRATMATPLLARRASHHAAGSRWVYGDQERREVLVLGARGEVRTVIRWTGPGLDITEDDRAREVEARLDPHERDDPGLRRFLLELEGPATRPAYRSLLLEQAGGLWVEDTGTGAGQSRWQLFSAEGRWLGPIDLPPRFIPTQVLDDRVVGIWRDDLDVEHVQIRPLRREPVEAYLGGNDPQPGETP